MTQSWAKMSAIVTGIDEEDKRGGIFVKSTELMGDEDEAYPHVVEPVFDWGWFYIPDIGEEVEIEVLEADDQTEDVKGQAFTDQQIVRWRGKRFESEEGESPRPINEQFLNPNFGKRRGFATPKGHVLLFDDTDGSELVQIFWTDKDGGEACISLLPTGGIELLDKGGNVVALDGESQIDVTSPNVKVTCTNLTLDAGVATLIKSATDAMVMGDKWAGQRATMNGLVGAAHNGLGAAYLTAVAAALAPFIAVPPPLEPAFAAFAAAVGPAATAQVALEVAAKGGIDSFEGAAATYLSTKAKVGT